MPWWDNVPKIAFFNGKNTESGDVEPLSTDELTMLLDKARHGQMHVSDLIQAITRTPREQAVLFRKLASDIRDAHRGSVLTYSRNVFVPVTRLCRDACFYCTFRKKAVPLGKEFLSEREVESILERAKRLRVTEVLFTNGERAEDRYKNARLWLRRHGYESTIEYLYHLGRKCLSMGLLPHINTGALYEDELRMLREVSASMGLMLENVSVRLTKKDEAHHAAPDKHPMHRLRTHRLAGKHGVPWTTGLLIGIGETAEEIARSLDVIRRVHLKYNHFIQEMIVQNFLPKPGTVMRNAWPPDPEFVMFVVALARCYLPPDIGVQVPPNLNRGYESAFIQSGICDWGGVSPLTPDYVNPEKPWPREEELTQVSARHGFTLKRRLPAYPRFVSPKWLSDDVWNVIEAFKLASQDGFAAT